MSLLLWLFPLYLILSSWLAWRSWRERPTVAWILIVLEILTTAAVLLAVFYPVQ